MNLTEHKARIERYEALLLEIRALAQAKETQTGFAILVEAYIDGVGQYSTEIPVPKDYALQQLQHLLWSLEDQAKNEAKLLGLDA